MAGSKPEYPMLVLPGAAALSRFRLDKLLSALQAIDPSIRGVEAYFTHFVDLSGDLDSSQRTVLERLLESDVAPALPDRKSTRLNSSHIPLSRMPSSA